jgi:hypothetical protein
VGTPRAVLASGTGTALVGLLLWGPAGDVEVPGFDLGKVGVVLLVLGAIELLYGLALVTRGGPRPGSRDSG